MVLKKFNFYKLYNKYYKNINENVSFYKNNFIFISQTFNKKISFKNRTNFFIFFYFYNYDLNLFNSLLLKHPYNYNYNKNKILLKFFFIKMHIKYNKINLLVY